MLYPFPSNHFQPNTRVSIEGDQWLINGEVINAGTPAEGLLMNVRMVNSVFEDRGVELEKRIPGFDPDENSQRFIDNIPEYVRNGVNAFTLSLQGGFPGYEGAVNTAFEPDGSLRDTYMARVARVIEACDQNNAVVILSLFYQRQHSHSFALTGKEAIKNAVVHSAQWIEKQGYQNVLLEISNEYRHGGFRNWPHNKWLTSEQGQVVLIKLAKQAFPKLLVSTSGMGDGRFHKSLARVADFILIHFNNTALDDYGHRIAELKRYSKPVICNEDHKVVEDGATALALSVLHGAGWGLMVIDVNQQVPFEFRGIDDDPVVFTTLKNLTSAS
jgi:hypothetical protein